MSDYLRLKFGTFKGGRFSTDESRAAFKKYTELPYSASCMAQRDTPEQRQALLELIDVVDGNIINDWSGDIMSREEAKDYIVNYNNK